jgi:Holliday junction resolvase RusA-like endonuclease
MQELIIKGKLPSLNEYVRACRGNRYNANKNVKLCEQMIMYQLGQLKPIKEPIFIEFVWCEKNKRRDKDNVASAKKFILDAMQYAHKLPNDNNDYILGFADRFIYGADYSVTLRIYSEQEMKKDE